MAGHSKWANIKHDKKKQDQKRGKLFTKLSRAITVAARSGDPDPETNAHLREAIIKAKASNMPNNNIERAIQKAKGMGQDNNLEEITYEGYIANGVAVMVQCLTDNRNRTVDQLRYAFKKCDGNLGTDGSVAFLFQKKGQITLIASDDVDRAMELAAEYDAEDIEFNDDGTVDIEVTPDQLTRLQQSFENEGFKVNYADINMIADHYVTVDEQQADKILELHDRLNDIDDVQTVYTNAQLPADYQ